MCIRECVYLPPSCVSVACLRLVRVSGSKIAPRPFGKDESRAEVRRSIGPSSGSASKLALGKETLVRARYSLGISESE